MLLRLAGDMLPMFGASGALYALRDEYSTTRAAGAVNGTAAEPGPGGNRTVVDTAGTLTIDNGDAYFNGGTGSMSGQLIAYSSITRSAGLALAARFTLLSTATGGKSAIIGFGSATTGTPTGAVAYISGDLIYVRATSSTPVARVELNTEYIIIVVLRAIGMFLFIKGGFWRDYTLLYQEESNATATLIPQINNANHIMRARWARTPALAWSPVLVVSDSFNRANGALGSTDGAGGVETGGSGLAWQDSVGTWAISSNAAAASALSGGVAIATVDAGTPNLLFSLRLLARAGGEIGMVLRYVDSSNYIRCYHDGTNVKLDKIVAGSVTNVASVAVAFTANRRAHVAINGNDIVISYPTDTSVGSTVYTVTDAALQTGTRIGLYTTNTGSTFDYCYAFASTSALYNASFNGAYGSEDVQAILNVGDSKTAGDDWRLLLVEALTKANNKMYAKHPTDSFGISGGTLASVLTFVSANLAAVTRQADVITINFGANDVGALPAEATWKADLVTMIDLFRAKWPSVKIYVARAWRQGYATECNTLATWIAAVVATYPSNVFVGMDERVWFENGDNGATYTSDGVHYNVAAQTAAATAWRDVINV